MEATGWAAGDPAQTRAAPGGNEATSRPGWAQKGAVSLSGSWGWGDIIRHWDVLWTVSPEAGATRRRSAREGGPQNGSGPEPSLAVAREDLVVTMLVH